MLSYMKKSETIFVFVAVFLLLCSLSGVYSESTEKTKSLDELYNLCKNSYESGDLDKAGDYADMFLSLYPEDERRAEVMLIRAFLQTSPEMAEDIYSSIIKDYTESKFAAKAYFHLGQSYYLLGQYDKALDHYGEIIVSYTDSDSYWKARYWRCKVFVAQGDYEEAIYQLSSLKDSNPDDLDGDGVLLSLANCYFITKDYEKAVENCRLIIDNMPDSHRLPYAYFLLSKSLEELDIKDEAKAIIDKLTADYPEFMNYQNLQNLTDVKTTKAVPEKTKVPEVRRETRSIPEPVTQKTEDKPKPAQTEELEETEKKDDDLPYYSIQVGAFSRQRNAEKIINRLKSKGYTVYMLEPVPGESALYKVRVGKFKSRTDMVDVVEILRDVEKLPIDVVYVK